MKSKNSDSSDVQYNEKWDVLFPHTYKQALSNSELFGSDYQDAWDISLRYHELIHHPGNKMRVQEIQDISVAAILKRAKEILGTFAKPSDTYWAPWYDVPMLAENVELDFEETVERSDLTYKSSEWQSEYWVTYRVSRKQSLILTIDTSLSMTGEKLALTAVALALVLLYFPHDRIGIIAFESGTTVVKSIDEKIEIAKVIRRFLEVPAQGYTHLESGLKATLEMIRQVKKGKSKWRGVRTLLMTDGKYTAGRDPSYLAPFFTQLMVLKVGADRTSLKLCEDLAHQGRGLLHQVIEITSLPQAMYSIIKSILRLPTKVNG